MKAKSQPLIIGVPGTTLGTEERAVIEQVKPAGVVLFSRNVETAEQVRQLTASLQDLETAPFLAVDLEGGAVNRRQQQQRASALLRPPGEPCAHDGGSEGMEAVRMTRKPRRPTRSRKPRRPTAPFPRPEHRLPPRQILAALDRGDVEAFREWQRTVKETK